MRLTLQRAAAGVAGYLLAYAFTAVLTLSRLPRVLGRHVTRPGWQQYWEYYVAAGRPTAEVVGWLLLSAHRVPMMTVEPGSRGVSVPAVFAAGTPSLYLVAPLACLLAGFTATRLPNESAPVETAVGVFMTVGYVAALVASAFFFRVDTGQLEVFPALFNSASLQWVVAAPLVPLVFGTLGAFVGTTVEVPKLRSVAE